jgi:GT2 family glycosyltransferase
MAQGEFVQFLDHDDLLSPNAFYEVARLLNENAAWDVIYYDEDKLSADGTARLSPFFKPDWSPVLLISANYLTHALMRRTLVIEAGKLDPATDGAQDWDLAFRVTERTNRIAHIPKVLYHWRQVSGSTSGDLTAKPWVFDTQIRCVENHLRRTGCANPQVNFPSMGFLRARWQVAGRKVSIIIPSKERVALLSRCLSSITQITLYPNYEFVIVDNGSVEPETLQYYDSLRRDPRVNIVPYNEKFNYSRANNIGARHATGDIFLFLNNDTEVLEADWLEEMVRWAERPDVGVVGAKLLYPDLTIQHAGVVIGMEGHASHVFWGAPEKYGGPFGSVDWYRNYTATTGACMMMRREVFETLGGFDEAYILAFSDIEICIRADERGLQTVYTPYARLKHYEGKTRGSFIPPEDIEVGLVHFMEPVAAGDRYFNPNLSYSHRLPTIAMPGEEGRVARLKRISEVVGQPRL